MLDVHSLTRRFGDRLAVDDVSFSVPAGHMVGFVGANGAGKTTTMRMIMGLLAPTAGQVNWNGAPISDQTRRSFGYMPEERGLYPKQPIENQLVYLGELHGMTRSDAGKEAVRLLGDLGLGDRLKEKLEKLSLGNQQRVQIAAALMASPVALVLDEPFSGLDPIAVEAMAEHLRAKAAEGVPVLFSSHQLELIDRLCDGLVILSNGRLVASGSRDALESSGRLLHRLVVNGDAGWVREISGVEVVDVDGPTALLELHQPGVEDLLVRQALDRGGLVEFARVRPTLSQIYREVTAA